MNKGAPPLASTSARHRSFIGLLDQGLFSATKLALAVLVARASTPAEFGAYSILMGTYLICLFATRGLAADTFVARFSANNVDSQRRHARACSGAAIPLGLAAAAILVATGFFLGSKAFSIAAVLAILAPGLLLQDVLRYCALAAARPYTAFASGIVIACVQSSISALLLFQGHDSAYLFVGAWGLATWLAAIYLALSLQIVPKPFETLSWFKHNGGMALRYSIDEVAAQGTTQFVTFAVAAVAGLPAAGALRAGQIVFSPISVLLGGVRSALAPELVRVHARAPARVPQVVRRLIVVLTAVGVTYALCAVFLPARLGLALFGETWTHADALLLWLGIAQVPAGAKVAWRTALLAVSAARRMLRARLIITPLAVAFPVVGAVAGGALGAATALSISAPVQAFVWWANYRGAASATRRRGDELEEHTMDHARPLATSDGND